MNTSTINPNMLLMGSLSIATAVLIWWAVSTQVSPVILPSPAQTWSALERLSAQGRLFPELAVTGQRVAMAFLLSLTAGTALGCAIGISRRISGFCRPLIITMQTTPPISWILLAVLWFDSTHGAPIFVVVVATFPIFVLNAIQGTQQIPGTLLEMARVFRVRRRYVIRDIAIPALWPFVSAAISICIGISWKTIVMAELFSSQDGAGAALSWARLQLATDEVLAWTLVIVALGITTELLFQGLSRCTRAGRIPAWKS